MSSPLCRFQHSLGRPGEGVHALRLGPVALVDVLFTLLAAWLLHRWVWPRTAFWIVALLLWLLGVLAHRLFCVRTAVDRWLFG